ncbi:hypothetical protein EJB05_10483, partial [Eragrostis curvula]
MSSSQEQRRPVARAEEEGDEQLARAEAHAREVAREIAHERTERARVVGEEGPPPRRDEPEHRSAGILETMQQSARSFLGAVGRTLGVARDTTAEKAGEYKGYSVEKAKEAGDATAQKESETAEATKEKLGEYKDYAADKATGMKDASAQKTSETAEATKDKLTE